MENGPRSHFNTWNVTIYKCTIMKAPHLIILGFPVHISVVNKPWKFLLLLSIAQSVVLLAKYLNEESNNTFKTGSANHRCKRTIMKKFSKPSTEPMMLEMLNGWSFSLQCFFFFLPSIIVMRVCNRDVLISIFVPFIHDYHLIILDQTASFCTPFIKSEHSPVL